MNNILRATAVIAILASTSLPANAFNGRALAEQECNSRIRRGFIPALQSAFDSCVRQQEAVLAPVTNSPGARGFCAGVEESIQGDPEVLNTPGMAAFVRQQLGC
jgi:hypothetical protein